ncbi:family 10 glycosylhydrolase [Promicromonospora sp. MEB111]|uniref:family 10 glycosylhydrolase n=1 Tax=Promicromonospora sp. MEB111 TaxID=3040301 RepID=UPI002549ED41|nr:family 10 glycosylhydrolase [Promicromonospora sp. MEB111]
MTAARSGLDGTHRWTQLTFVENDPLDFDLDEWADVIERTASTAVCISAGGYVAYYPTKVPLHHRSAYLGDRDLLGEVVDLARSRGMAVMARVDPHAVHRDVVEQRPDWIARTEDGELQEHWAMPGIYLTDAFGGYSWELTTEVLREIARDYDVDALFANRWQGHGPGYTETAAADFRAATGRSLPTTADPAGGEAWATYRAWRRSRLSDLVAHWDRAVQEVAPAVRFVPNLGSFTAADLEPRVARAVPFLLVDHQARGDGEALWAAGRDAKRVRALHPGKPVGLITSVGPESHDFRWKDSVNAAVETTGWIVDGFVHGAFPWFTKFAAKIHDPRWIPAVERAFGLHRAVAGGLAGARPVAEVLVWDADERAASERVRDAASGVYQVLVELGVPFEYVGPGSLSTLSRPGVRLVVVPEVPVLDAAAADALRAFAEGGGALLLTGGGPDVPGRGPLVRDLLGVDVVERRGGVVRNNYVQREPGGALQDGFGDARRVVGGTRLVRFGVPDGASGIDVSWRFVPDHPDLPMEEVYPRSAATDPAVLGGAVGAGRADVVGFNVTELYWQALQADHLTLLDNLVRRGLGGGRAAEVRGPGVLDVATWAGDRSFTVLAANLTDPMMMRGQRRAVSPIDGVRAVFDLDRVGALAGSPVPQEPADAGPGAGLRVEVLVGEVWERADVTASARRIEVSLPPVRELAAVHLTW